MLKIRHHFMPQEFYGKFSKELYMSEDWRKDIERCKKNNLVISCCYGILKIVKSSLKLNYET